ncbi:acyl carrier protein, partial [Mesorhizobium sp. 10.2.3]|uniref:acyl carrier protein n=1 Tax=Mesorhizobium sp. 10.2.3 TaxID=1085775 RepID=UPI0010A97794
AASDVYRVQPQDILPSDGLSGDLGIDSFARLELAGRLEELFACHISDEAINDIQTVEEVLSLVKAQKTRGMAAPNESNGDK